MKIFESKSRKEIEKEIKDSILLKEVYEMQDKLSREDFVLERFPDELLHELEKKELKEDLERAKKEAQKEIVKAKEEGIKQRNQELIKSMTKKGMSKEEIESILDIDISKIKD